MSMSGPQEYDLEFITDHVRDMTEHFLKNCRCVPTTRRPDRRKMKRAGNRAKLDTRRRHRSWGTWQVNRHTEAYRRMVQAGFSFDEEMKTSDAEHPLFGVRENVVYTLTPMKCVCGRMEYAHCTFPVDEDLKNTPHVETHGRLHLVDIAAIAEQEGAVSVEHLRNDGYSEEEIKRIRVPYDAMPENRVEQAQRQPGMPRSAT